MSKGWEFYWEGQRYYVGAPDAPTARKYLHSDHSQVAEAAGSPRQLTNIVALGLQLKEGTVRAFPGTRPHTVDHPFRMNRTALSVAE